MNYLLHPQLHPQSQLSVQVNDRLYQDLLNLTNDTVLNNELFGAMAAPQMGGPAPQKSNNDILSFNMQPFEPSPYPDINFFNALSTGNLESPFSQFDQSYFDSQINQAFFKDFETKNFDELSTSDTLSVRNQQF